MIDSHRQAFKEEAYELLTELETSLLALEETPEDVETIGRVFRAMHTIKGSGAMFGFEDIAAFTHEVETVFDLVRNGKLAVNKKMINLTLSARDHIKSMLDASDTGEPVDVAAGTSLVQELKKLMPATKVAGPVEESKDKGLKGAIEKLQRAATYRIRFKPALEVFMSGTNPVNLLNELRELGPCRMVAQTTSIPTLKDIQPDLCYVFWDILLTTNQGKDAIEDVFIFIADDCELSIEVIDDSEHDSGSDYKKLGEILLEKGAISREDMEKVLSMQKRFGELAVATGIVSPDMVQSALIEQQHVKEARQERQVQDTTTSIRVPAEKLDILVNLVGELVTVQARLTQTAFSYNDNALVAIAEEVERLSADLRDNALNIRMLPIGTTFSKFKRLVRDLSIELGKEIELTTEGAETELDKTVIERLSDPLVHLIRNSIDHGIEYPDDREAEGKPRRGTVHLKAAHSGDSVLISIIDDGAGINKEVIRAKALERGLIQPNAELSDKEIFAQIFAPGFSTAKKVTSVSGRGVGMDVVKRAIDALRGSIDISSQLGQGTTIAVRIPLTLAIIESLLVKIQDDCFVIPLSLVNECVELTHEQVLEAHGRNLANVRGHMVPYIPLRAHFDMSGEPPPIQQIVIVEMDDCRVGFVVDNVVGEHQTVIKTLGKTFKNVQGVSGATILGDGSVALILDIPMLMREVELAEKSP